jgi:glycosyltransferase involved in cell wall biosynthesis
VQSTALVSIVTPFYNTQEFLTECIESVLRQTYTHWEYILVDNCSTDGSSDIAKRYAAQFPDNIRVIRTDSFLSQVQNYNFALSLISPKSKYCKMVQADDWIFPDCVSSMVELAEAHSNVGIVAAYEIDGNLVGLAGLPYPSPEVPGRDACRRFFFNNHYLFGNPTCLLMRSELVRSRNPFYDERHAPFEDAHACFDALRTWNFGFVHQVLTYTRRDNESVISRIRSFEFELLSRLAIIIAHGRNYLSEDEYAFFLREAERKYFFFLGSAALQGRELAFWAFHREHLAKLNYSLNLTFLGKWILIVLLDDIGNPKRTFEYLWPRRKTIVSDTSRFIGLIGREFRRKQLPKTNLIVDDPTPNASDQP